jgi:hypothetical protein
MNMPSYQVFLGSRSAPCLCAADLALQHWQTHRFAASDHGEPKLACTPPPATLATAHVWLEWIW